MKLEMLRVARRHRRAGLTLLELVVVLAILAAVAAIVAPLLPNLLRRAHKSIDATQSSELSKAVQLYQALNYQYPNDFDLLLTSAGAFPSYLPGGSTTPFGGFVTADVLTDGEVEALHKVGITTVQPLATATTSPTLNPYTSALPATDRVAFTNATKFAVLNKTGIYTGTGSGSSAVSAFNPSFLAAVNAADPTARYVVFGVGQRSAMVGQVIQDAPTSVPQEAGFTPANTYCRVGVIFKVSGNEVASAGNRAKFVASVALEDDELEATEKDIVGYYEVAAGTNGLPSGS